MYLIYFILVYNWKAIQAEMGVQVLSFICTLLLAYSAHQRIWDEFKKYSLDQF